MLLEQRNGAILLQVMLRELMVEIQQVEILKFTLFLIFVKILAFKPNVSTTNTSHEAFVPEERSIKELFEEDIASSKYYKTVIDEDEDIAISGLNIQHILALE